MNSFERYGIRFNVDKPEIRKANKGTLSTSKLLFSILAVPKMKRLCYRYRGDAR